ncbi:MAG: hypothetical protein D6714_06220 [Bacteroidetes bacterium]|nr:MAG: hypothetical protein D6714_06220 [Bacteroidota bacterium]
MKISSLIYGLGALFLGAFVTACGTDSHTLSPGTYCFERKSNFFSTVVQLNVQNDGKVEGLQQNVLLEKSGEVDNITFNLFSGTLANDTLQLEIMRDRNGDLQVTNETWIANDTLLRTAKMPLAATDCSTIEWREKPTSVRLQGKWQDTKRPDEHVEFVNNIYNEVSDDRVGGHYTASFDVMDSCRTRLNSYGKFIFLQNGLCFQVANLTDDQLELIFPGLEPKVFKKVQ